jgi:hypothetical protein
MSESGSGVPLLSLQTPPETGNAAAAQLVHKIGSEVSQLQKKVSSSFMATWAKGLLIRR